MQLLVVAAAASSHAGYSVHTKVETLADKYVYIWTVYNHDETWGLDAFMLEVPVEIRVLAHTVPPPYSSEDGTGFWTMEERHAERFDPHGGDHGRMIHRAPRTGMKWLAWWGHQSPSVYPPGTSATFTLTTDKSVAPAHISALTVTYKPQDNPNFYEPWKGAVTGPGTVSAKNSESTVNLPTLQTYSVFGIDVETIKNFKDQAQPAGSTKTPAMEPEVSVKLHAGITIEGTIGGTYAIYSSDDINKADGWEPLGSYTLSHSKEIWFDPRPATEHLRFYKVVPELFDQPKSETDMSK